MALLKSLFQGSVAIGKTSETEAKKQLGNLKTAVTYESLRDVDLVSKDNKFINCAWLILGKHVSL